MIRTRWDPVHHSGVDMAWQQEWEGSPLPCSCSLQADREQEEVPGETTPENHNQSKCRVVKPHSNGYIYKRVLHLRLIGCCRRGAREIVRGGGSGRLLWEWVPSNIRRYPESRTNTAAWTGAEEGRRHSVCQTEQRKAHEASALHKELWITEEI